MQNLYKIGKGTFDENRKSKKITFKEIIQEGVKYTIKYEESGITKYGTMDYEEIPWQNMERMYERSFFKSDGTLIKKDYIYPNQDKLTLPEPYLPEINDNYLNTNYELTKQFKRNY